MKRHKTVPGETPVRSGAMKSGITVLHVDDDPNDTLLLQAAIRKAAVNFTLHNVVDGDEAMAYLSGTGRFVDRLQYPLPAFVLLDLKMPGTTGMEILKWIRNQPSLHEMKVVVLSGSEMQEDIRRAYDAGANAYRVKPIGFDALVELIKDIPTI